MHGQFRPSELQGLERKSALLNHVSKKIKYPENISDMIYATSNHTSISTLMSHRHSIDKKNYLFCKLFLYLVHKNYWIKSSNNSLRLGCKFEENSRKMQRSRARHKKSLIDFCLQTEKKIISWKNFKGWYRKKSIRILLARIVGNRRHKNLFVLKRARYLRKLSGRIVPINSIDCYPSKIWY